MKFIQTAIMIGLASTLLACSESTETVEPQPADSAAPIASGDLATSTGAPAGVVKIVSEGKAVKLIVTTAGLPDGEHGFHLHQTGDCTAPNFKSAGGHLNPLGKSHGSASPGGSHVGDLPNLELDAGDPAPQSFPIDGDLAQISTWLFDEDGTAVVIHADPDDYKTDPSGAAGARIACAVLSQG